MAAITNWLVRLDFWGFARHHESPGGILQLRIIAYPCIDKIVFGYSWHRTIVCPSPFEFIDAYRVDYLSDLLEAQVFAYIG